MIVKIDVNDAIGLGFFEVEDDIYLYGPVIGEYVKGEIHIDMDQDMSKELRAMIEREAIIPKEKLSDKFHK
jgi:hypothetical protein